jgi:hypothetical protein
MSAASASVRSLLALVLTLAACATGCGSSEGGGVYDASAPPGEPDAAPPGVPDAAPPAVADAHVGCLARDLDPAWLEDYEKEVVSKIAGKTEISPGLKLTDRDSLANREATRAYLRAELTAMGYAPQRQDYENNGANVYARLSSGGTGKPLIVLGAHYDGISGVPAAADDGTGVALVLAAARWFKDVDCRDTDVIFAFFDQEEDGLIGSNFFADKLVHDQENVLAVHTFDMISFDGDGDKALELWEPSASLQALYQAAAPPLGSKVLLAPHFASSDHKSFLDAGFVATGVGEAFAYGDHTPNYHTVNDTYDNVNFEYLRLISRVAFSATSTQVAPNAP